MPIKFNDLTLPGIVLKGYIPQPPQVQEVVEGFAGIDGVASIKLGKRQRMVVIPFLLVHQDFTSYELVQAELLKLDEAKAATADKPTLEVTRSNGQKDDYPQCVFVDYRQGDDILPDIGRCLIPAATDLLYFVPLELVFRQNAYSDPEAENSKGVR